MTRPTSGLPAAISGLLHGAGFGGATVLPLADDASLRRFFRILGGPRPAVLMLAPPDRFSLRPFLHVAGYLAGAPVSIPALLAADEASGLLLMEDLGDSLLSALLDAGADAVPLFDAAVDALLAIQSLPPPSGLPDWDSTAMVRATGASLFEWWWPAMFGAPPPDDARAEIDAALARTLLPLSEMPPATMPTVFVHRDWFAGNLFWMPDRAGTRRIAVIDFQDAAVGHPAYDLMALVQDPRREVPEGLTERAIGRWLAARPGVDPAAFRTACAICCAQRLLRVAAQWVRLERRDGKPQYLAYGPRSWTMLGRALKHPAIQPLTAALDRWIPLAARRNPPPAAAAARLSA
jgi:aminoglycoside/choline kinase family phosphotransferase